MKINILVPCYNAEKYIDFFVSNLLKVDDIFNNEKCIVTFYNDGSTDNTELILKKWCQKFPNSFTLLTNSANKGSAYSRNELIKRCKAEYFIFSDIDDVIHKNFLDACFKELSTNPDAECIVFKSLIEREREQ